MAKSAKGGKFERRLCKEFGQWWTGGQRDDVFWRSATSGARATQRAKQGKATFGQYGDIQATDPIGQALVDVCTIELKRGYQKHTVQDSIDKGGRAAQQEWEKWLQQAVTDSHKAGTPHWMLVTKRDCRIPLVYMPMALRSALTRAGGVTWPWPQMIYKCLVECKVGDDIETVIFGTTLEIFFEAVPPQAFIDIAKDIADD